MSLDGSSSLASNGRTIIAYAWAVVSASGEAPTLFNADTLNASFTAEDNGIVTLALTVTDDQGAQDSASVQVTANKSSDPAVTVDVTPTVAQSSS